MGGLQMSETTVYNEEEIKYIGEKPEGETNVSHEPFQEDWLITDNFIEMSKGISGHFWQFQQLSSSISDYMKDVYIPEVPLYQNQQVIFHEMIEDLYKAIDFDKEYLEEGGLELPNKEVINKAIYLIHSLSSENIFPKEITTTVEEGICLIFESKTFTLYLELYNYGEIGYMLENTKNEELIENEIFISLSEVRSKISQLFS